MHKPAVNIEITEKNNPIPEAITKSSNRALNKPAFYTITTESGNTYAGSTGSINKRISRHKGDLVHGRHEISELQKECINGCTLNVEVTFTKNREEAFDLEQEYLDQNFNAPNNLNRAKNARFPGQNVSPTEFNIQRIKETHTGKIVSEETRKKLSAALKGRVISEEAKEKLRLANLGKSPSQETREKISLAGLGRHVSDETCRKISEAKKGKGFPQAALDASIELRSRKVVVNGVTYTSMTAASKELGVTDVTIRNWANNPDKQNVYFEEK